MVEREGASLPVREGARALGRRSRALSRDGVGLSEGVIGFTHGLQRRGHSPLGQASRRGEHHRRAAHRSAWTPSRPGAGRAVAQDAASAAARQSPERDLAGAPLRPSRRLQCRDARSPRRARSRRSGGACRDRLAHRRLPSFCPSAIRIRSFITARSRSCARSTMRSLWPALLVRWEMMLLQDLGFGLDLSECAATGTDADLSLCVAEIGAGRCRATPANLIATGC